MRKFLLSAAAVSLSAFFVLSSHGESFADGSSQNATKSDRLQEIQSRGSLRVCIWPDYFSITWRNPRTGDLEGIDIDMARAFAEDLGVTVEFVDSSFAALVENITSDACDIAMHGVGIRPDRAEHMDFTAPHLISGIYAVAATVNTTINTWADIDQPGHVVVVQKGTYMEPVMREALSQAELMVVDDFRAREQEVQAGRADVFMTDFPYGRRMIVLTDWAKLIDPPTPLAPTPYAYAVPKGESDWLAEANAFVARAKADGRLTTAADRHGLAPIVVGE